MNHAAVRMADDEFYRLHPEYVRRGQRIRLDPRDPRQAAARKEWMALYRKHAAALQDPDASPPPEPDPALGSLIVRVTDGPTGDEVLNTPVTVRGPVNRAGNTGHLGSVEFRGLPAGTYELHAASYQLFGTTIVSTVSTTVDLGHEDAVFELPLTYAHLTFDGRTLTWFDKTGQEQSAWPAVSGKSPFNDPWHRQRLDDEGPIPVGRWFVRQSKLQREDRSLFDSMIGEIGRGSWPGGRSSWGEYRVWLEPAPETYTFTRKRTSFTIHGGDDRGSRGCIDLTGHMSDFVRRFKRYGQDLVLVVRYTFTP